MRFSFEKDILTILLASYIILLRRYDVMTSGGDIGILGRLTIWHDDAGASPDWYLEQVHF